MAKAKTLVIKDVPANDVDQSIADLKNVGATKVEKAQQADGKFTLTATFP